MKNLTALVLITILIAGAGFFVFGQIGNGFVINEGNGTTQKVILGMKDYNYYPSTLTVKAGEPVELTLDSSVVGCLRSFTIRDIGVNKYSRSPEDTIKFTIPKKGTYNFACSMGMAYGKITAE